MSFFCSCYFLPLVCFDLCTQLEIIGENYEHRSQRISLLLLDFNFTSQSFCPTGTNVSLLKIRFLEDSSPTFFLFQILFWYTVLLFFKAIPPSIFWIGLDQGLHVEPIYHALYILLNIYSLYILSGFFHSKSCLWDSSIFLHVDVVYSYLLLYTFHLC